MKKTLTILTAIMLVATAAYALDMMDEGALDDVSGQSGLTITNYTGSQVITLSLGGLSWGDDAGYTAAGATAGCLVIDALGTTNVLTIGITQASGNAIVVDVGNTGLYLGLGTTSVTVTPPSYFKLGVVSGSITSFGGGIATASTLGELCLQSLSVTVSTPSVMRVAPH